MHIAHKEGTSLSSADVSFNFVPNLEHIYLINLVFSFLTVNMKLPAGPISIKMVEIFKCKIIYFWVTCRLIWSRKLFVIYFSFINPIQDGGKGPKSPPPYQFFPCNFYKRRNLWLLVLIFLPHWCKSSAQCQSQIIELEPRPPFKKSSFSGQILIKLRLW